jgi:hypothetical protein
MTPEEEMAALKAENARLRDQVEALGARVQELQARLAEDSYNSGKPPSSDGPGRKTRRLRKKSGKKPGGQLGQWGRDAAPGAIGGRGGGAAARCLREVPGVTACGCARGRARTPPSAGSAASAPAHY